MKEKVDKLDTEFKVFRQKTQDDINSVKAYIASVFEPLNKNVEKILEKMDGYLKEARKTDIMARANKRNIQEIFISVKDQREDLKRLKKIIYGWGGAVAAITFIVPFIISYIVNSQK